MIAQEKLSLQTKPFLALDLFRFKGTGMLVDDTFTEF